VVVLSGAVTAALRVPGWVRDRLHVAVYEVENDGTVTERDKDRLLTRPARSRRARGERRSCQRSSVWTQSELGQGLSLAAPDSPHHGAGSAKLWLLPPRDGRVDCEARVPRAQADPGRRRSGPVPYEST
jgi:hypothetical protein